LYDSKVIAFFNNLPIRFKLLTGYTLIFIIATLSGGSMVYFKVKSTIEANIENELKNSTETILNMVKTAASTSIKNHLRAVAEKNKEIIASLYNDYKLGLTTQDQAKALAKKILLSQTIGKTGYLYCVSSNGVALVHPNSGVEGKSFLDHSFVLE